MRSERSGLRERRSLSTRKISVLLVFKVALALGMMLFLGVGVSAAILDNSLRPLLPEKNELFRLILLLQWVGFGGALMMLMLFVLVYMRGVNQYQRLYERISQSVKNDVSYRNPWLISFPTQDIFGGLGEVMNRFVYQMAKFDRIKTVTLKRIQERFEYIADYVPQPLILVHFRESFPYPAIVISFANVSFLEIFAKKSDGEYYDVNGMSVDTGLLEESHPHQNLQQVSVGELFDRMYEGEMADNTFLDKEMVYAINQAVSTLNMVMIEEKRITPIPPDPNTKAEPILCRRIEIRPFVDVLVDDEDPTNERREVREVLILFHEVADRNTGKNVLVELWDWLTKKQRSAQ